MTSRLHLLALLCLAGCSSAIDGPIAEGPGSTPGAAYVVAETGVAGLGAATGFSEAAIEAALPGTDASPVTMATETGTVEALAVFQDGLQLLQVVPAAGRIAAIHGVSGQVRGPRGERIGMTIAEARPDPAACRPGTGNWLGMPICRSAGAAAVTLVFAIPGYTADGGLPDAGTLSGATLERIIWTAPGQSPS